jgi:hypothetical protein
VFVAQSVGLYCGFGWIGSCFGSIIGTNSNTQTNIYGGAIGLLSNTTILGNLTSNSYNLSGTTPTLTKASLGYYVNYAKVSASYATSNKYLYAPTDI